MFRRVVPIAHKEENVVFPADLKKLGLFINDEDQLKQIADPEKRFDYYFSKVERLNERRRESLDECLRKIVHGRLKDLGLTTQMLPLDEHDNSGRKVPIFVSDDISTNKDKTLIIIPDAQYDFGIWSYRVVEDSTINQGSLVSTVKRAQAAGFSIIIMNVGQHIWSPYHNPPRAVTYTSWKAATKKSNHIDDFKNRVPLNENYTAHVSYVMDNIVKRLVASEAKVYMFTAGFGAMGTIEYFNNHYDDEWKERLQAIVFCETPHSAKDIKGPPEFKKFVQQMCRTYITYAPPKGDYIHDRRYGCHVFSSGEMYTDCVVPAVQDLVFKYFEVVERTPEIANPQLIVNNASEETEGALKETIDSEVWENPEDPGPWKVEVVNMEVDGDGGAGGEDGTGVDGATEDTNGTNGAKIIEEVEIEEEKKEEKRC